MVRVLPLFEYLEPEKIGEAVCILSTWGAKAKVLAGGVDLVDRMRRRKVKPECVVSIQRIPGLDYINSDGMGGLKIGALTTLRSLELAPLVHRGYPFLWDAVHQIGSIQVKNLATAVGNLCVATPASDLAPPLVSLGAKLQIASPATERIVPVENFFMGVNQSILQPGDIVTELLLPSIPGKTVGVFMKLARTATDIAKVNVAVMLKFENNRCQDAKIALGSVAPTVVRARKAEGILKERKLEPLVIAEAARAAAEEVRPISDLRSTAEYRKEMVEVVVRRAIDKALERTQA